MPDYSKGKIYKIVCNETGMVYVGSTTQNLNMRLNVHRCNYNEWLDGKINWQCSSFAIIQFDNYHIELIEYYPCENKMELEMREGYWQKQIDCINKCIAGACGDKQEYMKEYHKKYELTDKRKEYNKTRRSTPEYKAYQRDYQKKWIAKKKLEFQSNQNNNLDI